MKNLKENTFTENTDSIESSQNTQTTSFDESESVNVTETSQHDEEKKEVTNSPTLGEVLKIAALDSRVGHYIIDLLAGISADDAFKKHFSASNLPEVQELLADAEQKGYIKGKNEKIALEMRNTPPNDNDDFISDYTSQFLINNQKNIW